MKAGRFSAVKGSTKTTGSGFRSRWTPPVKRAKSAKSRPKAANARRPKTAGAKPFRRTWHRSRDSRPFRRIFNLAKWLRKET